MTVGELLGAVSGDEEGGEIERLEEGWRRRVDQSW